MNLHHVSLLLSAGFASQLPESTLPEIVFSGKSNVGKSSLINCLLGRKSFARVSATPGKTATINFYNIDDMLFFADLPGYGFAKVSKKEKQKWAELVDGYFSGGRGIGVVVQLLDMRHKPTVDDLTMLDFLRQSSIPHFAALTKCDKLNKTEYQNQLAYFEQLSDGTFDCIPFSAVTRQGKEAVLERIERCISAGR